MKTSTPCWEMTASEFCRFCYKKTSKMGFIDYGITDDEVSASLAWWKECLRLRGNLTPEHIFNDPWGHKRIIRNALNEGKHVPENVLADYPAGTFGEVCTKKYCHKLNLPTEKGIE